MKKALYTLFYFLSPLILIFVLYSANPIKYSSSMNYLVGMILGCASYTWLIFQFVLSARPKWVEVHFGMDKFYRLHGIMAVVSVILVVLHQSIMEEVFGEGMVTQIGTISLIIFVAVCGISLLLMVNSFVTKLPIIKWVRKTIDSFKIFKYEHYLLLHNLTAIALILMTTHVLLTSSAKYSKPVFLTFLAYFVIGVVFYLHHKFTKPFVLRTKSYVVQAVTKESPNMWSVKFSPRKGKMMKYKPGQFGFYKIIGDEIPFEEHPFSISSSPTNKNYLSITVKELGDYTAQIGKVKVGDHVLVDGPYGRFSHLHHKKETAAVFIVGGVGITPALSMLRYMKDQEPNANVMLIWGMNNLSDFIHKKEFEEMQKTMKNFKLIPVVAKDDAWTGHKGYIDLEKIKDILSKNAVALQATGFYLCGPPVLMDNTIKNLKTLGVDKGQIHFEKFSL